MLKGSRESPIFHLTNAPTFCTVSQLMARKCQITGKHGSTGNRRSHSRRATKRTFSANIIKKRVFDAKTGTYKTMRIAASYLRTLAKQLQAGK